MADHAILAPSSAHRWLNCQASALLEAKEPDKQTDFALEGTLAHAYCAMKLKKYLLQSTAAERAQIEELSRFYSMEMDDYVAVYFNTVVRTFDEVRTKTPDAKLLVEVKLDFTRWIPEGFGTADAVIVGDGTLHVFDFKYGKGVKVDAEDNCQMKIYGLGALEAFRMDFDIDNVCMTIVQPRIEHISSKTWTAKELGEWGEYTLKPRAEKAISGEGRMAYGDWCRFCRIRSKCPLLIGVTLTHVGLGSPRAANETEILRALQNLPAIKTWVAAFEDMVQEMALSGETFPGYKLVEGRSVRTVNDPQRLAQILAENGLEEEKIYKKRELQPIGTLEKLVGKKRFAELSAGVISKPEGKPTLVPESDPRPAINDATEDFKDIE